MGAIKYVLIVAAIVIVGIFLFNQDNLTSKVVSEEDSGEESPSLGPSLEEQTCLKNCASQGCDANNMTCMQANSEKCVAECNAQKPEVTEETSCMEACILVGCDEYDFDCQNTKKDSCEKECGMIKAPGTEDMSAEQLCITNCVSAQDPNLICGNSQTGETGNSICQECAASCVHLYAGPCLDDAKLKAKQKECETCEHCYGSPVMGDSGEGWECIVNVECKDASGEFGDNPGIGEGITKAAGKVGEAIGNVFEGVANFFKNIFNIGEESETE